MGAESNFLNGDGLAVLGGELAVAKGDRRWVNAAEHVGRQLRSFFLQLLQRHVHRGAADCSGSAAESADAILHDGGVAVYDRHVIDLETEFVGGDLRK